MNLKEIEDDDDDISDGCALRKATTKCNLLTKKLSIVQQPTPAGDKSINQTVADKDEIGRAKCNRIATKAKTKLDKKVTEIEWFPNHISKDPAKHPLIPYPQPAPKIELRGSHLMTMCFCLKRNGLQADCPHTGCQGNTQCIKPFLPACVPSGLGLPPTKQSYLQKADDPECYDKDNLEKAFVLSKATGGGSMTNIDNERDDGNVEQTLPEITSPSSSESLISKRNPTIVNILIPNSPPNYISEPPVNDYPAPCRRHKIHGVPGSGKYNKFRKCRRKLTKVS